MVTTTTVQQFRQRHRLPVVVVVTMRAMRILYRKRILGAFFVVNDLLTCTRAWIVEREMEEPRHMPKRMVRIG
jgi:hypothetical protein